MREVDYKDIRTSQYILVKQERRGLGPYLHFTAMWAGKVVEVNGKWLRVKHNGVTSIVAESGEEQFFTMDKKEFNNFIKEFNANNDDDA